MFISTRTETRLVSLLLFFCIFVSYAASGCPNGCSSRGICVNNVCTCADGLTGSDCSTSATPLPSPYQCPTCYTITVGPAQYYSGPSWRLPDGPIVGLNYQGSLSVWQGNTYAQRVAQGADPEDWEATTHNTMFHGNDFDSCGAWPMRFITDGSVVKAFYHAERACNYPYNGQTRKSAGLAQSYDGGNNITSIGYPNNKLIDTATPVQTGKPNGEGDIGVAVKDGYYYMYFSNVEDNTIGVAKSPVSSGGVAGTWTKYFNYSWSQPGLGGLSTGLSNIPGTQAYLHTPSNTFLAVGGGDPYYSTGTGMAASDDGINWKYVGDPLVYGDFSLDVDTIMYQSLLGNTFGYDVGTNFDLFYMWIQPGDSWLRRQQIRRSVTMTYTGSQTAPTLPQTKIALTSYTDRSSGKQAESVQYMKYPNMATTLLGYIMTRPYYHTFPLYECYNYAKQDYFIGSVDECYVPGVQMLRVAGHMWSARVQKSSVAVYRCSAATDMFLTLDPNCGGRAPAQSEPFGFTMQGPEFSPLVYSKDVFIGMGSQWTFTNSTPVAQGTLTWYQPGYTTGSWYTGMAPFGDMYDPTLWVTPFGNTNYYFRSTFVTDPTRPLESVVISSASDDFAILYVNGVLVDSDNSTGHEAAYWNRQVFVPISLIKAAGATNLIAVEVKNGDSWAFFDLEITARYVEVAAPTTLVSAACAQDCGLHGQCGVSGTCVCDNGWSGIGCSTSLCTLTGITNITMVSNGSTWRHNATWSYVRYTPGNWFDQAYDDGFWQLSQAPFGNAPYGTAPFVYNTQISWPRRLFRKTVTLNVPAGESVISGTLFVASHATHRVWVNGVFIGDPILPYVPHTAKYWNGVYSLDASLFNVNGANTVAVELLPDGYGVYFDLMVQVQTAKQTCLTVTAPPSVTTTTSSTKSATTGSAPVSTGSTPASTTSVAGSTTRAATTSTNATPSPTTSRPTNVSSTPKPSSTTQNADAFLKGGANPLSVSYTAVMVVLCGILIALL